MGLSDASHVSAGGGDSCALTLSGSMLCWGDDGSGELGDGATTHSSCTALRGGTTDCSSTPVTVASSTAIAAITSGVGHTCALHTDGTISCWGSNESGQLGDGTLSHTIASTCAMGWDCSFSPVDVGGVTDAIAVAAGGDHTCALHPAGVVSCWGLDAAGQLGDGPATHTTCSATGASLDCSPDAVAVVGVNDAVEIATGAGHACVRRASGGLACWGDNTYGQLGNETTLRSTAPVPVVLP
jgi:alpha-tubulin suppressor-like RCC1 family protein